MCGICGYISKNRITKEELRIMNDTMYHRGPNDSGVELYDYPEGYTVGFAQRRLSILDLSPLGHQPMHSQNDDIIVVFNGEIYNFLELKEEITDYPFKTSCDTEVIIASYLKWGADFVDHIHGMFSIALFDKRSGDIYLVRDRIGKKPLYYWYDGTNIVFASELKPIVKCPGFVQEIRKDIIPRYLHHQYINGADSIYKNVYKLEPGCIMRFKSGKIEIKKYWDVREAYYEGIKNPVRSYEEAKNGLKERLNKAVADRMIADVPLGTFLSGGYDSSLVSAIAQSKSSEPIKTFCIGFDDPKYNEAQYAKEIAKHLGTDHTELYINEKEMFDLVESIPQYFDEPFADSSQIPTMLVSKLAREKVTVALSGDGGDEFFCGYNIYKDLELASKLDPIGNLVYGVGQIPIGGDSKLLDKLPFKVRLIAGNHDKETKVQIASDAYINAATAFITGNEKIHEGITDIKYPVESDYKVKNWQIRRMLLDMDTYLPGDILVKMDRASMKYSLESRCPIMDTAVMEYSYRIPHEFKYYKGDKKHILKDIAYDYIPKELLERPKKGFGVPLDTWMRGPLRDKLIDYSSTSYLQKQGIFDPSYVSGFIDNYLEKGDGGSASGRNFSKIAWSFFVFQQWYEYYF
ncbi:MAG: asparagine synthase (glutamine-hydrolyzing) [Butyrivibrio sp.]|nr:asparagine synthase (glutamine-hydrolyzing) [Butyrivibrio sp.]